MSLTTRLHRRTRPSMPFLDALEPRRLMSAISFAEPAYYPAGTSPVSSPVGPRHLAVGDFTNDGIPDLVAVGGDMQPPAVVADWVRVLPGKGDGTFGAPLPAAMLPPFASDVAVGDFDGDRNLDVVVSLDRSEGTVALLPGRGDGTFGPGRVFASGAESKGLAVADFNGDGRLDVAVANAGEWSPPLSLMPPTYAGALLLGNGDGTLRSPQMIHTAFRPQHFVEAGDVNGDGRPDLVFGEVVIGPGDFAAPESRVFASVPFMDVPARPPTTVPAAITGLKLADLNGDGRLDVAASAMRDFLGNNAVAATLSGTGDGRFAAAKLHDVGSPYAADVAVADFNADGRPDLAIAEEDPRFARPTPVPAVLTLENMGAEAFGGPQYHPLANASAHHPARLATGLFNRDRLPDVAAALSESNQVGVLLNDTQAILAMPTRMRAAPASFVGLPVARFAVTGERPAADALRATINWGDGTRSTGTVVANSDGTFSVLGSHSYRYARPYVVSVLVSWPAAEKSRLLSTVMYVAARRPAPTR